MLAAQICRELRFSVLASRMQSSRVPRCLFGPPNPRDTIELLQEALESERARFAKRWGIDPLAEDDDKENSVVLLSLPSRAGSRSSPAKRRASPYAKQTNIHDYWRSRKICDISKKSSSSAFAEVVPRPAPQQQQQQPQPQQQPQQPEAQTQQPEAQTQQPQAQTQQQSSLDDKNQPSTN